MENDFILNHFQRLSQISREDYHGFLRFGTPRVIRKNGIVLEQGNEVSCLYFIKSGCLVTYHEDKNKFNHVVQFGMETWWTGDLESATKNTPSTYSVKALTDSAILQFPYVNLESLIKEIPSFQQYFRFLFQNALISQQRRIKENISLSAEQRYESFLRIYPKSELIIPQKYIASYLGITPEFLSKMKSKQYLKDCV